MPGTQSLTAVFYKGEYRIAHPGLWDGYPEGHGLTALEFIRDQMDYDKFTDKLMKLRELSDADRARIAEMMEDDWRRQYPHLTQDGDGSEILSVVQDGEDGLPLNNWIDSVGDSSYWQWAYVIDFDKGTFEVYRGSTMRSSTKRALCERQSRGRLRLSADQVRDLLAARRAANERKVPTRIVGTRRIGTMLYATPAHAFYTRYF